MVHSHVRRSLLGITLAVAAALAAFGVAGRGPAAPPPAAHSAAFTWGAGRASVVQFGGIEEPDSSSWQ